MKKHLLAACLIMILPACKKCYQCTVTVRTSGQGGGTATTTSEVCDMTKKQKEAYEKAGTSTTVAKSGNVTIQQTSKTVCK